MTMKAWLQNCVSAHAEHDFTWQQWKKLAEFSSHIDFGCSNGRICAGVKRFSRWHGEKRCCIGCNHTSGYLERIPKEAIESILLLWGSNGFWSPQGCRLPRQWRSSLCLRHYCPEGIENKTHRRALKLFYKILSGEENQAGKRVKVLFPTRQLRRIKHLLQMSHKWLD